MEKRIKCYQLVFLNKDKVEVEYEPAKPRHLKNKLANGVIEISFNVC